MFVLLQVSQSFPLQSSVPTSLQQHSTNDHDHSAFVCPPATSSLLSGVGGLHLANNANEDEDDNYGLFDVDHAAYAEEEVDEDTHVSDEEIIKAGERMKMARAQRALVNEKMD